MNGNICLAHALARFNKDLWTIYSFLYSYSSGGLQWFSCISLVSLPIVPNAGGDLWWFVVVCGGLWWFAVVCLLVIPLHKALSIIGLHHDDTLIHLLISFDCSSTN